MATVSIHSRVALSDTLSFLGSQSSISKRSFASIETAQRHCFADDPMAAIARRIAAAGHELQLHVHPCWSVFRHADWRERVRAQPRQDDFAGRSEGSSIALIEHGQRAFADWGQAPSSR